MLRPDDRCPSPSSALFTGRLRTWRGRVRGVHHRLTVRTLRALPIAPSCAIRGVPRTWRFAPRFPITKSSLWPSCLLGIPYRRLCSPCAHQALTRKSTRKGLAIPLRAIASLSAESETPHTGARSSSSIPEGSWKHGLTGWMLHSSIIYAHTHACQAGRTSWTAALSLPHTARQARILLLLRRHSI